MSTSSTTPASRTRRPTADPPLLPHASGTAGIPVRYPASDQIRPILRIAQWGLAAVIVLAALYALRGQLANVGRVAQDLHPRWGYIVASGLVVLATYALLVESWRRVLAQLGGTLSFAQASRVWFVSNLARYVPGTLWQLGALSVLAQRYGVPAATSAASAVVITIVNVLSGFLIFAATGAHAFVLGPKGELFLVLGVAALALAPFAAPRLAALGTRLTGRDIVLPRLTLGAVALGVVGTAVAWVAYGWAFQLLAQGVLGPAPVQASIFDYVAVYTGSYLAGFLSIAPPAGLGVADAAMLALLAKFGIATVAQATVLTVTVRLWRTVLEVVPGLLYMGFSRGAAGSPTVR